jgi:hypothetical protein
MAASGHSRRSCHVRYPQYRPLYSQKTGEARGQQFLCKLIAAVMPSLWLAALCVGRIDRRRDARAAAVVRVVWMRDGDDQD